MATPNGANVHPDTPEWFQDWLNSGFKGFLDQNAQEHGILANGLVSLDGRAAKLEESHEALAAAVAKLEESHEALAAAVVKLGESHVTLTDVLIQLDGRTAKLEELLPKISETLIEIRDRLS